MVSGKSTQRGSFTNFNKNLLVQGHNERGIQYNHDGKILMGQRDMNQDIRSKMGSTTYANSDEFYRSMPTTPPQC